MLTAELPSAAMPKRSERPVTPSDTVRFTALMTREERARFKYFCERIGAEMETLGARWILDRLADEERKLDAARRPPRAK